MHTLARHLPPAPRLTPPATSHRYLARLCELAYSNPWIIREHAPDLVDTYDYYGDYTCPRCQRRVTIDTQAQLYRRPGRHYLLIFRGSDTPADWLANLDSHRPCHHYGMPIHAGFLHGYQAISHQLQLDLHAPAAITIAGHSKGGGEAIPAAYDLYLRYAGELPVSVITFGAPRVARAAYARAFNAVIPATRYLNGPDPVPWLPPFTLGYRQVGTPRQLQPAWWRWLARWRRRPLRLHHHHPVSAYLRAMETTP